MAQRSRKTSRRDSAEASVERRPELSRDRILSAAEAIFSERGFDAATLREVAAEASVPLSLITYHFADKLNLYREVFQARVPQTVQQRLAGLALADLESDQERRRELIVKALLVPMLGLRATHEGRRFAVLLAREITDPSSIERGIVQDLLSPVTNAVLPRLESTLPDGDRTSFLWAYSAMIGATLYMLAGGRGMKDASGGLVDPDDVRTCTDQLVAIALSSFRSRGATAP